MASTSKPDEWERCIAVVTGSTGGIGKAIATELASGGFTVVVNGRSDASVAAAVTAITASAAGGGAVPPAPVLGVPGDLATEEGCAKFQADVDALAEERGLPVGVLVNNMGIFEAREFWTIPDEAWHKYIETNFFSGLRLSRHWLKPMLERGWGRVLFIASEAGVRIIPDMMHYSITKQMQIGLTRGLAQLTRGTRVTVNTLLPGPTWTEGVEEYIKGLAAQQGLSVDEATADYFKRREPTSLIGRFIRPQEVAAAAAFLASEGAAAVNGAAVRCEGGLIAHV